MTKTTASTTTIAGNEKFVGNDKVLFGIIFGVLAFWLFAQTTLNIAPAMARDLGIETSIMNIAVSITALFSGIFIVVIGGLADRLGRVRMVMWGFVLSIVGSLLIGFAPTGSLAEIFLMIGRIFQGLSGACIMSASLALIQTYWKGAARQRAISLWSIGSWGRLGFCRTVRRVYGRKCRLALDIFCIGRFIGHWNVDAARNTRKQSNEPRKT